MVAVSRIFGSLYLYTFRWIVVIVALQVFTLGWGIASLLPRPSPLAQRRLAVDLRARQIDTQLQLMKALGGGWTDDTATLHTAAH